MCIVIVVTGDGKLYACGEATNGRLGLGNSTGSISVPRQLTSLNQYVIKKVAVHSGKTCVQLNRYASGSIMCSCTVDICSICAQIV